MYRVRARRGDGTPGTEPFSASGVQRKQCPKWERFKQPTGHLSSACWGLEEKGFWLSSASPSSRGPERSPAPGSERWGKSSPSPAWCSDPCRNCSARGTMNNCTKKNHRRVTHKPPRTPKNKRGSVGAALGSQCPARRQRMGRKSPWGPGWGLRGGTGAGRRLWDRASRSQTRSVWGCQAEADTGLFWDWLFPLSGLWHGAPWRQSATLALPLGFAKSTRAAPPRPGLSPKGSGSGSPLHLPSPCPVSRLRVIFFKKQSNKTG